ncbi:NUDIX domain-containing protein [Streptomyces triticagri]|uniref:NUDIX domain-containing protein n=1 Tax=Streptomyces triticagri TaxID=2293568 RepID=A0A372M8K9_9ACTN|nr:NUDIX domain-containing protein [Streptomyces triticagri]
MTEGSSRTGRDPDGRPARHTEIVDVHLIVRRAGEVLLARRKDTGYADGLLHAPSGHVESGEDVRTAMIREAREEAGLALEPEDLRVALVMQHQAPGGATRTGWFFETAYGAGGEPYNAEPHKCSELSWHPLTALPDDLVAYCRAGLDAYLAGDRFVLHRHAPDDPVAHRPGGPSRSVPLAATDPVRPGPAREQPHGAVHHIELWVPDLGRAEASWGWLLGELGHLPYQHWESGRSWRRGDTYLVIEESDALTAPHHDRTRPGLNHLALHVRDRPALDALVAAAPAHGWTLLFPDLHPYAGGAGHCAAYLEDADGFEVELVAG